MRWDHYDWKVKNIPTETMRRVAEAGEGVKGSNAVHENIRLNEK